MPSDAEDTVALLKDLADPEPMLELGIGTGRIALWPEEGAKSTVWRLPKPW